MSVVKRFQPQPPFYFEYCISFSGMCTIEGMLNRLNDSLIIKIVVDCATNNSLIE